MNRSVSIVTYRHARNLKGSSNWKFVLKKKFLGNQT